MNTKTFLDGITAAVDAFVDRSSQNGATIKTQFRDFLTEMQPDIDSIISGGSTDPNALNFIRDRSAARLGRIVLSASDTERMVINETFIAVLHAAMVWAPMLLA